MKKFTVGYPSGGFVEPRDTPVELLRPGEEIIPPNSDDSTRVAAVDKNYHWMPIGPGAPLARKVQLINRDAGVAFYGKLSHDGKQFWTHYALLPTFEDEHATG